jgi:hypothetical protein
MAAKFTAAVSRKPAVRAAVASGTVRRSVKVAESPAKVTTHEPSISTAERGKVAATLHKDALKAAKKSDADQLVDRLLSGDVAPTECKASQLDALSAEQLRKVCSAKGGLGLKGYSGLSKAEMVKFVMAGGVKPAAKAGSTRQLREVVSQAKKDGKVSGPVSSMKVAELKKVASAVQSGKTGITVSKPAPNAGTMDYNKNLLRPAGGKGFSTEATAKSKAMFGVSISALKAPQLRQLVAALGL